MNKNEIIEKVLGSTGWFHSFEIVPGIVTPGRHPYNPEHILNDWLGVNQDLTGLKVLEIGAWDGALSFELERRGAQVTATDIQDPENSGFNVAKEILDSKVEFFQASIYDLSDMFEGEFDIILMLGVLYHLKHPLLAMEELQKLIKDDGAIYIEGEELIHYVEDLDNTEVKNLKDNIKNLEEANIPVSLCYPGKFKNGTNWFIPNLACLKSWSKASGLEIQNFKVTKDRYPDQRYAACLVKSKKADLEEEHPVYAKDDVPKQIVVLKGRAKLFFGIGKFEEAKKMCKSGITLIEKKEKKTIFDYYNAGSFYQDVGELEMAEKNFRHVTEDIDSGKDNLKAGAYFHLGEISLKYKNEIQAKEYFKDCLKLNPYHECAKDSLENGLGK